MSLYPFYEPAEVLGERALSLQDFARHCAMSTQWVVEHVHTGVFSYDELVVESSITASAPASTSAETGTAAQPPEQWRFSARTLSRARRIARLENNFDADPQLAALTADLIEEVQALRAQLQNLRHFKG